MRVEESIQIARPPQEVWALVADPENDPRWCRKVRSVEATGESRWNLIHKPVPLRPAMELVVERVAADPPRRLALREEDDGSVFEVEYRLEEADGATRFTQVSEFEWKRLPKILHRTFDRGVRRDVRGQLRALKQLLEA
ncbi:MAG: SRPBCC family protein [Solirubrobacterales bacterium]